jgi:hypothetical protein
VYIDQGQNRLFASSFVIPLATRTCVAEGDALATGRRSARPLLLLCSPPIPSSPTKTILSFPHLITLFCGGARRKVAGGRGGGEERSRRCREGSDGGGEEWIRLRSSTWRRAIRRQPAPDLLRFSQWRREKGALFHLLSTKATTHLIGTSSSHAVVEDDAGTGLRREGISSSSPRSTRSTAAARLAGWRWCCTAV